jgi:hypothetical protein
MPEFDLEHFHATEIEAKWRDRVEIREHVKARFSGVAVHSGIASIAVRIAPEAWSYFRSIEPAAAQLWPSSYYWCFQNVIRGATDWSIKHAGGDAIASEDREPFFDFSKAPAN